MRIHIPSQLVAIAIATVSGIATKSFLISVVSLQVELILNIILNIILNEKIRSDISFLMLGGSMLYMYNFDFSYFLKGNNYLILVFIVIANLANTCAKYKFLKNND